MRSGLNVNGAGSEAMKMQRQDVVLGGPCPCIPDACSSRDLEAKERGCLRLSEDAERLFSRWATTVHLVCRSASCVRRM